MHQSHCAVALHFGFFSCTPFFFRFLLSQLSFYFFYAWVCIVLRLAISLLFTFSLFLDVCTTEERGNGLYTDVK